MIATPMCYRDDPWQPTMTLREFPINGLLHSDARREVQQLWTRTEYRWPEGFPRFREARTVYDWRSLELGAVGPDNSEWKPA